MKLVAVTLVVLLTASAGECLAQGRTDDGETAPKPGTSTRRDNNGADITPGPSLRVTIRPTHPWQSYVAPLADDPRQNEPISATVYDEDAVRDAQIEEVEDLANVTPGMQMSGVTNRITLRGAGDLILFTTAQSPVGLYIDDVYVPNPAAFNFDLFDIGRIEVLRGAQGFNGGRGAIAGDVRISTVGAKPENSASLEANFGSFAQRQGRVVGNGTTTDKMVSNRLAASFQRRKGTVFNRATGENINTRRNWGIRDNFSIKSRDGLIADINLDYSDSSAVRPATGGFDTVLDHEVNIFKPTTEDKQLYGASLRFAGTKGEVDWKSISALRGLQFETAGSDASASNLVEQGLDQSQFYGSQELRFSSRFGNAADWTAGAYMYGQRQDQESFVRLNNSAPLFGQVFGHTETSFADQELWSAALFGEATWHATDDLDLIAGLRGGYEHQELDYRYEINNGAAVLAPLQVRSEDIEFSSLFWKLGASYKVMPGVAPYVTVSRGSKPGGFNTTLLSSGAADFKEETATTYEVGVKSAWLGGAMVVNAAAFYLQREDQQVQNIGAFNAPTVNARKSRSEGIELMMAGRPERGLDLQIAYSYLDTTFEEFPDFPATGGGTADLSGRKIPFASTHSASATIRYERPLSPGIRFLVRADYAYRTSFYFDPINSLRQPSYGLWNARLGIKGDSWSLFLWGKNLTNTRYRVSAARDGFGNPQAVAGDPRTVGINFRYQF